MLSIIIPTLNEEKYLPKLLESIKKQSFKGYEIIVADFNSKDGSREIAKKYHCKIIEGGKIPVARNNGAKQAKGDILFFIDADCIITKQFLQNAVKDINKRNLDVAGCYAGPLNRRVSDNIVFSLYNSWLYMTQFFCPNAALGFFCKKNIHQKIKGFNENTLSEDTDYIERAGKYGKFRILKTEKIYTSMRRFEKEGRLRVFKTFILWWLHRKIKGGIREGAFEYEYGKF